jgi:hypothetical protein
MARKPKQSAEDAEDTAPEWPVIDSYTTKEGLFVKIYKEAYCVPTSNPFSARGRHL